MTIGVVEKLLKLLLQKKAVLLTQENYTNFKIQDAVAVYLVIIISMMSNLLRNLSPTIVPQVALQN